MITLTLSVLFAHYIAEVGTHFCFVYYSIHSKLSWWSAFFAKGKEGKGSFFFFFENVDKAEG